jgi:iron complex outermembrane receptor protein
VNAQEKPDHQLDEVVVTSSRTPVAFSDLTRSVIVIYPEDIKEIPVNSVQDLLQYVSGVDIKQRGVEGVQADINIRGGSFEQTLILVDGFKISDPQTGHHNLNLPIVIDNIERIEILKGQGSSIYGANAFSGVINIITKKGRENALSLQLTGGQNGYYQGILNGSFLLGELGNQITFSKSASDGYRYNTDFDIINFSYSSSFDFNDGSANLFAGYNDKKFGANGFYSERFPNQWEHTTTKFINFSLNKTSGNISLIPKIYWRRNDDEYLLDYKNPSFYKNIHQTNVYGAEIQSSLTTDFGITTIGGEYTKDIIESSNLGNHQRENYGAFAEQNIKMLNDFDFIIGAFAYHYAEIGWKLWPGFDVSYKIKSNLRLFASIGKSFRMPSYTELYYSDPVTIGNPNLKHEESVNYEIGINFTQTFYNVDASVFRKEGSNLIDWVRTSSGQAWNVKNIADVNTNGFEIGFSINPQQLFNKIPLHKFGVGYTYLSQDKSTAQLQSRYVLDYLKHQLIINISNPLFFNIEQSWFLRYEDRVNIESNFLVDTQLSYKINLFDLFVKATNLFNKSYKDITGLPLPGRWITAGIKYSLR